MRFNRPRTSIRQTSATPASATDRRGTAAVEFAVILPTLILIVLATIDLSRLAHASYVVSNALHAGADVAATKRVTIYTQTQWEADVLLAIQEHLQQSLGTVADSAQVSVSTVTLEDDLTETTLDVTLPLEATADWPGFGGAYVVHEQFFIRQYR